MRVLLDTNIIIDFIIKRDPFFTPANDIFKLCINKKIIGCMASHSVPNIFYILRKSVTDEKRRRILRDICNILFVVNIDKDKIINALNNSDFSDFEDCLQDECAEEFNADFIITRNIKDFTSSKVKAITPEEFIETIKK